MRDFILYSSFKFVWKFKFCVSPLVKRLTTTFYKFLTMDEPYDYPLLTEKLFYRYNLAYKVTNSSWSYITCYTNTF